MHITARMELNFIVSLLQVIPNQSLTHMVGDHKPVERLPNVGLCENGYHCTTLN